MADGVVILPSYYEAIRELPDEYRLAIYDAIIAYGIYGEIVDIPFVVKPLFTLMRPNIDASQARHRANKINGGMPPREGSRPRGRPPKNQTENQTKNQTENQRENQEKEKETEKEKENENEKENEIDIDFENKNDIETEGESERDKESLRGEGGTYLPLDQDTFEKQRDDAMSKLDAWKQANAR